MTSVSSLSGGGSSAYLQMLQGQRGQSAGTTQANATSSTSDDDEDSSAKLYAALDTDGDGKVSQTELQAGLRKLSDALNSALLGAQEQGGRGGGPGKEGFAQDDANGDGLVSADEFKAGFAARQGDDTSGPSADQVFSSLDTDGDGQIDRSEAQAAREARGPGGAPPLPPSDEDDAAATETAVASSAQASGANALASFLLQFYQDAQSRSAATAGSATSAGSLAAVA